MVNSIKVNEKYSNNWKPTLYTSLAVAAVTFIIYLNLEDVIWTGIFRLTAFMSFSLSIFCTLKVMEGRKTFQISIDDGSLKIAYLKNDKELQEDIISLDKIEKVYKQTTGSKIPLTNSLFSASDNCTYKIQFKNDDDICLLKFGGRVLSVDSTETQKLESFFSSHNLFSKSNLREASL